MTGDSGEGKSYTTAEVVDGLYKDMGLDFAEKLDALTCFTPLEYSKKFKAFLHDKELKPYPIFWVDEGREVVKAKMWSSFINQTISDVNAMARGVKNFIIFWVTQDIGDITKDVRKTIQFYGECSRPKDQKTRLFLYRVWKDTRDIENVKLRKRMLRGIMRDGGTSRKFIPKFRIFYPRKEIINPYEKIQKERKARITLRKLEKLQQRLEKETFGQLDEKIDSMLKHYSENPDALNLILYKKKGKIYVKSDAKKMHELTDEEYKEFGKRIKQELKKGGMLHADATEAE